MIVLQETITERGEAVSFTGVYASKFGTTIVANHFEEIDANATRWTSWCKFSYKGVMKFLSLFTKGSIRKRTEVVMQRFKLMVETDEAGRKQ